MLPMPDRIRACRENHPFHHEGILADDITICPSLIGMTEYSKQKIHQMSLPAQLLLTFSAENAVCSRRRINLHDVQPGNHELTDPRGI